MELELGGHIGADPLDRRSGHEVLPPGLHPGVLVEEGRVRGGHEVEGEGEVVEVREAEGVPGQVPALGQPLLVRPQHPPQPLQALVDDLLVRGGAAHDGEDDALEHHGRDGRVVLLRFHLRPHVHHCRPLGAAVLSQQVRRPRRPILAQDVPRDRARLCWLGHNV
uniref:Uncharacterized protein n=2 Tax=Triticum urartu TaxID=4572 RepID=A0A8R7RDB4_TRIUA